MLRYDRRHFGSFIDDAHRQSLQPRVESAHRMLVDGTGAGSDMLGWRRLLLQDDDGVIGRVADTAARIRREADVLLCLGIGGSYLGARAVIDALSPYFGGEGPEVLFGGHHMSEAYHRQLLEHLRGRSVFVNVISKSGTTLETALAFRLVRDWMTEAFGDEAASRIIVTTGPEGGALNRLRDEQGYEKFVLPDDVGGRFSVLTPVGLLPVAVAGIDIRALVDGARQSARRLSEASNNAALDYAADRFLLHESGYVTEIMSVFEPRLRSFGFWWQQLFGESEGKDGMGLFPVTAQYSTDLHSIGQYVQDGQRKLIETFLMAGEEGSLAVPAASQDLDGLNYLAGRPMAEVNRVAYEGTAAAHLAGGVPNCTLWLDEISPESIGDAIYFFEHAVSVSGYLLDVNPFDQPGVEEYKREMYRLLGRA
jgi:glucose-6-phosphate isomerase